MRIGAKYSHMNGEEYLLIHRPELWKEVQDVIAEVDAAGKYKTKISAEKRKRGQRLYDPVKMNKAFKQGFESRGWRGKHNTFWVTDDEKLLSDIHAKPVEQQKALIEKAGHTPIKSSNQTDFVKDRVAVEVQLGKYAFVAHDLFVKHLSFFASDAIDVGIEIVPMKQLAMEMSSGPTYYERDLLNVVRQGRGVPAVPLVLVGLLP